MQNLREVSIGSSPNSKVRLKRKPTSYFSRKEKLEPEQPIEDFR